MARDLLCARRMDRFETLLGIGIFTLGGATLVLAGGCGKGDSTASFHGGVGKSASSKSSSTSATNSSQAAEVSAHADAAVKIAERYADLLSKNKVFFASFDHGCSLALELAPHFRGKGYDLRVVTANYCNVHKIKCDIPLLKNRLSRLIRLEHDLMVECGLKTPNPDVADSLAASLVSTVLLYRDTLSMPRTVERQDANPTEDLSSDLICLPEDGASAVDDPSTMCLPGDEGEINEKN